LTAERHVAVRVTPPPMLVQTGSKAAPQRLNISASL
jgi:hypothetical protein